MKRRGLVTLVIAVLAVAGLEAIARAAFDFPLYEADDEVGYWLQPRQQGRFLFTNDWAFNAESLGVADEFRPSAATDVLLVGDSVVYGGNGLRQADKLGPLLQKRTGWRVWPAAAPGWSLQNELAFLRRDPSLLQRADVIVFVLEGQDFKAPSQWVSNVTHPRERPWFFLPYLFDRYFWVTATRPTGPYPVKQRDVLADWAAFGRAAGRPIVVVSHSNRMQGGEGCGWVPAEFMRVGSWSCFDALQQLGDAAFRDDIHPTAAGNNALAALIEMNVERALAKDRR